MIAGGGGESLSYRLEEGILEVELHQAPANEIGRAMLDELERVVEILGEIDRGTVRAMVITSSEPRGFCAGADLRELHRENRAARARGASDSERVREVRRFLDRIHAVLDAIDEAPFTTIAAVSGVCFGGGFELALACDLIVADRSARFAFPELRLGLVPGFGGLPRLSRDLGNAVARDLLLTGRSLGAERAYQLGLVSQLVAPGEARAVARRVGEQARRFDARATEIAKRFAKPIPKEALAREKDVFCELFTSPVVEAALARFDASTEPMPYLPPAPEDARS